MRKYSVDVNLAMYNKFDTVQKNTNNSKACGIFLKIKSDKSTCRLLHEIYI